MEFRHALPPQDAHEPTTYGMANEDDGRWLIRKRLTVRGSKDKVADWEADPRSSRTRWICGRIIIFPCRIYITCVGICEHLDCRIEPTMTFRLPPSTSRPRAIQTARLL